jgi:peroxiredoxin
MAEQSRICEFGKPAIDFDLLGVDGQRWTLADCAGKHGTLIMFICNHCPFVQAIRTRLVEDAGKLAAAGVGVAAIMPNDTARYPEDSYDNMQRIAREWGFTFPYLYDEAQDTARAYGAVCTPDFFGFNASLELQYRGRLDAGRPNQPPPPGYRHELLEAMLQVAKTGQGPKEQIPSVGCSIKWRGP